MRMIDLIPLFAGLGIGSIGVAVLDYFKEKRKRLIDARIAERTQDAQVAQADIATIQAKISSLERIIDQVSSHNDKLQKDVKAAYELLGEERAKRRSDNQQYEEERTRLMSRIHELEEEIDKVRRNARQTQDMCDNLANQVRQLTADIRETHNDTATS